MTIEDLTKAFWMLNRVDIKEHKVVKVEDNVIYMDNGMLLHVTALADHYDREYGE